ncbi:bifunctional phosphopantothenoylcysteine decarboxylase/phosphopantothenate--cysteine ligase CoaBC [Phocicoccus pinnipedialis]|uniref:Coenzyme A biosynthesis bifunctional protein CoaBC n=1 Tax=Phocicoccus pinnipedialis TaxID=110845 RepID=A0A6V7RI07_9BACL|nr:bifunctional phosphopantothenoylcysteine decarboxylase/phosphopantothenate--cysteine ligase CoaBC [Jeotgalicoccus pinnipedialis]MBP1939062.1 phosphopantothenoylcysteine decarboxylase/phosphopantothenate--cysteine ligase [Jeotgalicoccus pinnipedialis]CAD2076963.1 Coenzyme A biosynthesis bifunctional protein CoaBC [Jeotgalicoccus pinnipedialis]
MANIVIGVTGGIASYKAIDLTSKLIQNGHSVRVVLTDNTLEFVTPLAFQAISRNHVYIDTFKEEDPSVISHIHIGEWADVILVVPATANTIGKLANGIYDNMLLNVLAATNKPVIIAPAMNVFMLEQPPVQKNIEYLKSIGYRFLDSEVGFLACGYIAKGRLADTASIIEYMNHILEDRVNKPLTGKKVLITAGPTREKIDPIRYITNISSGKMGYSLAKVANHLGADVTLVSGPVNIEKPDGVTVIDVVSTDDMFQAVKLHMNADIGIFSAAVSDYTPKVVSENKMKKDKKQEHLTLELKETTDILQYVGSNNKDMYVVGFAAETHDVERYAREKLKRKNADCIVMNDVSRKDIGMNSDENEVMMIFKDGGDLRIPKSHKDKIAERILETVIERVE